MTPRLFRLVAATTLALPLVTMQACDDADAAARVSVAQSLSDAASESFLAGSDSAKINEVIRSLQSLSGGTKIQMATRDRMLSSMQLQLASIEMNNLYQADVATRHDLLRLRAMADVAVRMSSFASARENNPGQTDIQVLSDRREQISAQVEQLRQQSAQTDEPIRSTMADLELAAESVSSLRRQAQQARDEAAVAGTLERFPIIEKAIDLEREADRIEAEMMRKELSLELAYRPAKEMFNRSRGDLEAMVAEIDAASGSLEQSARDTRDAAAAARSALSELDGKITRLSREVSERISNDLRGRYETATRELSSAASNAKKAGRGGENSKLAREELELLKNRIELADAELAMMRDRGLDEWIRILEFLSSNDDLGNRDAWKLEASEARTQRDSAAQIGLESIDSVLSSSSIGAAKLDLERSKAFLSGTAMPEPPAETASEPRSNRGRRTPPAGGGQASSAPAAAPGTGYPTPQALAKAFNDVAAAGNGMKLVFFMMSSITSSSPELNNKMRTGAAFGNLLMEVLATAKAKFGGTPPPEIEMAMEFMNMMSAMRVDPSSIKVTGDKASVEVSMMGQSQPAGLIKTASGWMLDGDDMPGQAPSMGGDVDLSKLQNILKQLQDGTISNQDQFNEAMGSISLQ